MKNVMEFLPNSRQVIKLKGNQTILLFFLSVQVLDHAESQDLCRHDGVHISLSDTTVCHAASAPHSEVKQTVRFR